MEMYIDALKKQIGLNIDHATLFKHAQKNGLVSNVLIEKMFDDKKDNDIFAIGILLQTGAALYWYAGINEKSTIDEKRIAYQTTIINNLSNEYPNGSHCGDCT